jgi:hypothetical protein
VTELCNRRAYEHALRADNWHVEINVTYIPTDGSGGGVTFTVGTKPAGEEEEG